MNGLAPSSKGISALTATSIVFLLVLLVVAIAVIIRYYSYTPYVPVKREGAAEPVFVAAPELLDAEHVKCIVTVLRKYNEPFLIKNHKVYIKRSLANDKDLLANYTSKALELQMAEGRQRFLAP